MNDSYAAHPPNDLQGNILGRGKYVENGREYSIWHKGKYLFPVDEIEMDRMDAMHKFFMVARRYNLCGAHIIDLDNLNQAPANPQILDLGCGTGIWALDVAKKFWDVRENKFKDGHVWAVDKCLDMQPQNIYPNSSFIYLDMEEPWPAEVAPDSKHLIHARMAAGSVLSWPQLYIQAFRHLTPGNGWFEQVEIDWDFANDHGPVSPRLRYWSNEILDATDRTGRSLRIDRNYTIQALAHAGFVDIREEVLHIRVNGGSREPWEIDVGRWFNLCLHKGFMGLSLAPLVNVKQWTPQQVEVLQNEVLREISDRNNTSYCRLYVWSARRPGSEQHNFR
ncbi:hypothetical protein N0V93_001493 [Gnomoniopsis smithogilvyi]|uniref:Methyltransferase n=1 Tax=Gnomoniopsis smithogilvyi TaxID=1191159 RepID=A0A9W8Z267_9PEZI|nr:hypothetical protein N0V93_001493 [Gnomoniopsis smithogilvyi]